MSEKVAVYEGVATVQMPAAWTVLLERGTWSLGLKAPAPWLEVWAAEHLGPGTHRVRLTLERMEGER